MGTPANDAGKGQTKYNPKNPIKTNTQTNTLYRLHALAHYASRHKAGLLAKPNGDINQLQAKLPCAKNLQ